MKYFAVILPMKDADKSEKYRQDHLDFLEAQREAKRVFMYGRLVDGAGGLIIYQGNSLEDVEAFAKEDPYVRLGAREFRIHEWAMQTDYTITE